ncbi:50S ribosomal protein L29 [Candidatus Kaiserbacteria bacterium RIFCSPHIGHO2_01_FULL_48_10]|uniref:Large ribosomal subunit protein uL29 n=2 Tax=Candidatus Kaiserbacteria bacterium RIFCSPHIGHO2_01_FULL_48_10 TaxID=1798476 RepID=A0A1F6C3X3_9BACT|nr:MAG: 50S ribosomal protein L29 [Candidatus Kaiserbacteria bacterium RIFCSPHIGHO2_01_FULL_48_10]
MKPVDVRKKSPEDLQKLLNELQADLREFRFGMSGGRTKNVKKARAIRADIARVHTILSEKTR